MKIQVLGSGCPTCKSLYELTKKAISELGMSEEIEYITDISKIIEMGVMTSPVLAIDGKPVMVGSTNNIEKIKDLIKSNPVSDNKKKKDCCGSDCDCSSKDCKCTDGTCDMNV